MRFSRAAHSESGSSIKVVSKHMARMLQADDASPATPKSKEFNFFIKRLKQMTHDMVVLDSSKSKISFYSGGYTLVHKIDTSKLLTQTLKALPDVKIVNLSDTDGSNVQLHLSDGSQKRITLRHEISDYMVNSILKVLKKVLPNAEYTVLIQDVVSIFSQVKGQAGT